MEYKVPLDDNVEEFIDYKSILKIKPGDIIQYESYKQLSLDREWNNYIVLSVKWFNYFKYKYPIIYTTNSIGFFSYLHFYKNTIKVKIIKM